LTIKSRASTQGQEQEEKKGPLMIKEFHFEKNRKICPIASDLHDNRDSGCSVQSSMENVIYIEMSG
jgi:hypothetical protein